MLSHFRDFLHDQGGTAALEMAAVGTLLMFGAMNAAEIGRYAYQVMDVSQAAQAGARAALVTCNVDHTPATQNCPNLQTAVTTAIQSTRLGADVQLNGALTEGYYCRTTAGGLALAGGVSAKPADCTGVANAEGGATPVLYLKVGVTHAFQPLFPAMTLADRFAPNIVRTAWMRMA